MKKINDLPEELIRVILGSARNAARFSTQSKMFRDLFNIIQHLELDYSKTPFTGSFTDYVDGVVSDLPESCTRVRKFTLRSLTGLDQDEINRWVCRLLNCGVWEIEMAILGDVGYSFPPAIFDSKTLVMLRLGTKFAISFVPENASLPSLETLVLDSIQFQFDALGNCALRALLRACPVLKELVIKDISWESWNWSGVISSKSLKTLTILRYFSDEFEKREYQGITFDTPSLECFDYGDFVPDAYHVVSLDSLFKASLDLMLLINHRWSGDAYYDDDPFSSNPTNLINGIRNVNVLELSSPQTFDILYLFRGAIPMFKNLHHLKFVNDDSEICWRFLPFLLEKAPNLKTLLISGRLHYDEDTDDVCECLSRSSCLLSCNLEILEIDLWHHGTDGELEQVKDFLGKLSRLLLLKVHFMRGLNAEQRSRIATDLLVLPRASSECVIEFIWRLPTQDCYWF